VSWLAEVPDLFGACARKVSSSDSRRSARRCERLRRFAAELLLECPRVWFGSAALSGNSVKAQIAMRHPVAFLPGSNLPESSNLFRLVGAPGAPDGAAISVSKRFSASKPAPTQARRR